MITVSDSFKEAMRAPVKEVRARLSTTTGEVFASDDTLIRVEKVSNGYYFGTASHALSFSLLGTEFNLLEKTLSFTLEANTKDGWESCELGRFKVYEQEADFEKGVTKFKAYDLVGVMGKDLYKLGSLGFPCTVKDLAANIANHYHVNFDASKALVNQNYRIEEDLYEKISNITYRDILAEISGATASLASIRGDDLVFSSPQFEPIEVWTYDNLKSIKIEPKYGKVNTVTLSRTPEEDNIVVKDENVANESRTSNILDINRVSESWLAHTKGEILDDGTLRVTCLTGGNYRFVAIPITNAKKYLGKTLTVSARVEQHGANLLNPGVRMWFIKGQSTPNDNMIAEGGGGDTISYTFKVPDSFVNSSDNIAALIYVSRGELAAVANDYVDFKDLKIEVSHPIEEKGLTISGMMLQEKFEGRNLYDYAKDFHPSVSGITSTLSSDGLFTVTGIPTANYVSVSGYTDITSVLENGQTYTISQTDLSGSAYLWCEVTAMEGTTSRFYYSSKATTKTFTVDKSKYTYRIRILTSTTATWGTSSRTISSKFQLEKGSSISAFEPYTSSLPVPNPSNTRPVRKSYGDNQIYVRGKNLLIPGARGTSVGVTWDYCEATGEWRSRGTTTTTWTNLFANFDYPIYLEPGIYIFSIKEASERFNLVMRATFTDGSYTNYQIDKGSFSKYIVTTLPIKRIYLYATSMVSGDVIEAKFQPMLERINNNLPNIVNWGDYIPQWLDSHSTQCFPGYDSMSGVIKIAASENDAFFPNVYTSAQKLDMPHLKVEPGCSYQLLIDSPDDSSKLKNLVYAWNESAGHYEHLQSGGKEIRFNTGKYTEILIRFGSQNYSGNTLTMSNIRLQKINTEFEPYCGKTLPISLPSDAMFGDGGYNDEFFYENGKWYFRKWWHQEVFDGTGNWYQSGSALKFQVNNRKLYNQGYRYDKGTTLPIYSEMFSQVKAMSIVDNKVTMGFGISAGGTGGGTGDSVYCRNGDMSLADFRSYLATNNLRIYVILETPEVREIIGESLLKQLENIKFRVNHSNANIEFAQGVSLSNETHLSMTPIDFEAYDGVTPYEPFVKNGDVEIKLANNEILDDDRESLAQPILDAIKDFEFYPFQATTEGHGWHEVGDRIQVRNGKDFFDLIITDIQLIVDGGLKEVIKGVRPDEAQTNYALAGGITKTIYNTEIKVDKQNQEISSIVSRQDSFEGQTLENFSQVYQDIKGVTTTIQSTGGGNLIHNSVGYNKDSDGWLLNWDDGGGSIISETSPESVSNGALSGNQINIGRDSWLSQRITVSPDSTYTLSFKAKKTIVGSATIKLKNDIDEYSVVVPANEEAFWKDFTIKGVKPSMNYFEVQIFVSNTSGVEFAIKDLILTQGDSTTPWVSATDEILSKQVAVDSSGLTVHSSSSNDYTQLNELGLNGYSDASGVMENVFTLNRDETEVSKLKTRNQLSMPPLKIVPITSGDRAGWAFVKLEEE